MLNKSKLDIELQGVTNVHYNLAGSGLQTSLIAVLRCFTKPHYLFVELIGHINPPTVLLKNKDYIVHCKTIMPLFSAYLLFQSMHLLHLCPHRSGVVHHVLATIRERGKGVGGRGARGWVRGARGWVGEGRGGGWERGEGVGGRGARGWVGEGRGGGWERGEGVGERGEGVGGRGARGWVGEGRGGGWERGWVGGRGGGWEGEGRGVGGRGARGGWERGEGVGGRGARGWVGEGRGGGWGGGEGVGGRGEHTTHGLAI